MKKSYLIITDSSITLEKKWADENDVKILPLSILRSDELSIVDDWVQTSPKSIFEQIDSGYRFKTSCTPIGVVIEAFEKGLQEYEKIIFVGISDGFSSQFANAYAQAKQISDKIIVVDTQNFGYALEDLIYELKNLFLKNPTDQQIIDLINNHHLYTSNFLACENIKGLIDSGRIPKIIGTLLKITGITPIIKSEYKNHKGGISKNIKSAPHKMMTLVNHVYNDSLKKEDIKKVCILEGGLSKERIAELVKEAKMFYNLDDSQIIVKSGPPIFLVYTWRGSFGYQFITHKKKEFHWT